MGLLDDAIREHLDLKRSRGADPAEIEQMEREALGPVRREPTIGAAHFDAERYEDERYEPQDHQLDLLDNPPSGYRDSTAPRSPRPAPPLNLAGEHTQAEDLIDDEPEPEQQPKRRFLRRTRPEAQPEPPAPVAPPPPLDDEYETFEDDDTFADHEDFADTDFTQHGPEPPHEPDGSEDLTQVHDVVDRDLADHQDAAPSDETVELDALPEHEEPGEEDETPEHDEAGGYDEPTQLHEVEPPHLRFKQLPKRPHFTPEPPSADEPDPEDYEEPEGGDDEDVLEETPEFLQDTPEHDRLWFEQRPPRDFDFDG